jgi:hypothetical protein
VHDHLGAAAQRVVRHRVHVADDHIGAVPRLDQRVGAAVHPDEYRLELPDVRAQHVEVGLVVVAPDDDQHVSTGDAGLDVRYADAVQQQVPLLLEVFHRVGGERLQLDGQPLAGVDHQRTDRLGVLAPALPEDVLAPVDRAALDADRLALAQPVEQLVAQVVDERDAGLDEHLGAEVRVPAGDGRFGVEHRRDPGGHQGVGRDPVEVDVVDDGDVPGPKPTDEPLRPAVEPRGTGDHARFGAPGSAQGR